MTSTNLKKQKFILFISLIISLTFSACGYFGDYPGFKETDSGLLYKFHEKTDHRKANIGDYITVEMTYKTNEDSLLFDGSGDVFPLELVKPLFAGDINEALAMMSKGDSATFVIRADSFLLKNARLTRIPDFIDEKSKIIFNIRMHDVQSLEELEKEKNRLRAEKLVEEEDQINDYILENNVAVNPTESGLYFIPIREGNGAEAKAGKMVKVHYTGKFLNGALFDSSYERGKPIEFELGRGRVISGWDEGIAKMKKGGKAILLIPSDLGYGEGRGEIPPYTPLLFEVELIDVK
ncbi:MAG: FKBP-type peptidyl-prolyl cis-trans isomerase [Bacteroidales bacterium]|nr:FKBP-type peptidyl-prolyl cis-trans isomerase [Bacteroidales bacterium]